MKLVLILLLSLMVTGLPSVYDSIYDFTRKDIDGNKVDLDQYKGKVVMIVNVASKCGYTPQYEGLEAMYDKYKDDGLVILGFPANNFKGQEPGTDEEIKEFCTLTYGVQFPMFSKVSVLGEDQDELFTYLTNQDNPDFKGDISWNFEKFLINKEGKLIRRFKTKVEPESEEITKAIELALSKK
tara:strand:+ start:21806 stop:22354 length:549 start_codon:yes stop_codon:yes gene_type:complete